MAHKLMHSRHLLTKVGSIFAVLALWSLLFSGGSVPAAAAPMKPATGIVHGVDQCIQGVPCITIAYQEEDLIGLEFDSLSGFDVINLGWFTTNGAWQQWEIHGFTDLYPVILGTTYTFYVEGCVTHFLRPSTCTQWSNPVTVTTTQTQIQLKWQQLGYPGSPVTGENIVPGGDGFYVAFSNDMSIYCKAPSNAPYYGQSCWAAHEIHGLIRQQWASMGWERSWLAYPISDETRLYPSYRGAYSQFEHGCIYFFDPTYGGRGIVVLAEQCNPYRT